MVIACIDKNKGKIVPNYDGISAYFHKICNKHGLKPEEGTHYTLKTLRRKEAEIAFMAGLKTGLANVGESLKHKSLRSARSYLSKSQTKSIPIM